ncbi:hypothetical protein BOX15_Mlig000965g3 [Macrostomum lignano]|uniref:RNA-directed RNA polymerase n=6 Tax=Macrostomum lignano TaxID=282301 RepID=A0A267GS89_9PLAT|nr:hypothetical protein BOX15_Mlig000965g3 [Macrostomum lignano]
MQCGNQNCCAHLLGVNELFFFIQSQTSVHLALKPELREAVAARQTLKFEPGERHGICRVVCRGCQAPLGKELPHGPSGASFVAFGLDKIVLQGKRYGRKDRARNLLNKIVEIEKRNLQQFFSNSLLQEAQAQPARKPEPQGPIKFASIDRPEDFNWRDLLVAEDSFKNGSSRRRRHSRQPRRYQLEAFAESLQRNLVLVMPTGSGKTLVAALLLARMKILNPSLMGALLVERVPLVFQQAQSLELDTGLRVAALCGENATDLSVRRLREGSHDILVATAGLLLSRVLEKRDLELTAFSCIVLDECHHAGTGGHNFSRVLDQLKSLPEGQRPRLLGLTASPVELKDLDSGKERLRRFKERFPAGTGIFRPAEARAMTPTVLEVPVSRSAVLDRFLEVARRILLNRLNDILRMRADSLGVEAWLSDAAVMIRRFSRLLGYLRSLRDRAIHLGISPERIKELMALLDVIDVARTLGLSFAVPLLQREMPNLVEALRDWLQSPQAAGWQTDRSERLRELENELTRLGEQSRALVFVSTRRTAKLLVSQCLAEQFRQLRPQVCIGQGGPDGMRWEDEQEVVIDRFNSGESRLMVSTSVLEEGLDIGQCDVVVRFDAARSLVQLVQSRGRARRPGSRFIVVADADEREAAERLRRREATLDTLLGRESMEAGGPCPATVAIVDRVTADQSDEEANESAELQSGGRSASSIWTFSGRHLVIRLFVDLRGAGLKDLIRSLEEARCFRVSRVDEFASSGSAVGISGVFPGSTSVVVACIDSGGGGGGGGRKGNLPALRWWRFCCHWSFRHRGCPVFALPQVAEAGGDPSDETLLPIVGLSVGRFSRESEIEVAAKFDQGEPRLRCIPAGQDEDSARAFAVELYRGCLNIRVDAPGTNGFALVDWQLGLVAVPVRFCPKVLFGLDFDAVPEMLDVPDEAELNPVVDGNRFLDAQATCQLLLLHLDQRLLTPAGWLALRRHFPVPLLETRLTLVQNESEAAAAAATPDQTVYEDIDRPQAPKRPRMSDSTAEAGFDCRWLLRVALDARRFRLCSAAFVEPTRRDIDDKIDEGDEMGLLRMAAGLRQLQTLRAFLADPAARLETCRHLLRELPQDKLELLQPVTPPETVRVLRALVSPTRVVCLPSVPVESSRLLRRWTPEGRRFLLVVFTDEAGNSVRNASQRDKNRFTRVLMDGLLLAGRRFRLLSASGSQLRSQRCLFVDAEDPETIAAMRHSLVGSPLNYNSVPKYLARLALFHTGDKPAVELPLARVGRVQDRPAGNGDLLTDGCGKISSRLAAEMADRLGYSVSATPSAYQFRYAGAKGVLVVVDPDEDPEFLEAGSGDNIDVLFRPSMEKFRCSTDTQLCVVQPARALPVRLNREAITLLESLGRRLVSLYPNSPKSAWQSDLASRLHELQEAALARASEALTGGDASQQALQEYIEPHQVTRVASRFDLASEPHWRSLLRLAFQFRVQDLRSRTALPVDDGCRVMGAADPTGLLAEGEVYLRIRNEEDGVIRMVEGPVLVYRNPCLHPGDLRLARAVSVREKPQLRQWVNVLLIPAGLDCRASLAADCSGGDLDGDQFSVIWDRELVPPPEALHPALNYAELAANPPTEPEDTDVSASGLVAEFYLANLENTFLGRVAHMHLALCDLLQDGACDPLARKLAESQSVAVDFPKTGIVPQVPKKALEKVQDEGYPDFMEKPAKKTYKSEKLLGQLYRRCLTYALDWDLLEQAVGQPTGTEPDAANNPILSWPGWEKFASKARIELARYQMDVRALLGQWGLASERELALARSMRWHSTLRSDLGSAQRRLREARDALFARYRREFESDPELYSGGGGSGCQDAADRQRAKAAAWYFVAARHARDAEASDDVSYDVDLEDSAEARRRRPLGLSFPWIVADILCDIGDLLTKSAAAPSAERNLQLDVGMSAIASLRESLPALSEAVGRADTAAALIRSAIDATVKRSDGNHRLLDVAVYGSASVFLCDAVSSDVDLCVTASREAQQPELSGLSAAELQRHWLRNAVSPALDRVATNKVELLAENRMVPLIRCQLSVESDDSMDCDISMNTIGLEKTRYLLSLYSSCPHRLPLLRLLVDWARAARIVRSPEDNDINEINDGNDIDADGERRVKMPTAEFYALALHCLRLDYDGAGVLAGAFSKLGQLAGEQCRPDEDEAPRQSLATQLAIIADQLQLADPAADADAAAALGARILRFFRTCAGLDSHVTYRWPIPSGQSVIIAAEAVRYAAKCARAALLRLHYSRDVAMVTAAASAGICAGVARFAKTLPHRLSQELGRAAGFHEARLASATGCARVQLLPLPDRPPLLRLTAEGDAGAVARLRREVRLMAGAAGWLLRTCHRRRACRYFMDGASLLLGDRCLSEHCRFRLVNCVSGVVGEHRLKTASLLRCLGSDCPDRDVWLEAAARRLFLVMSRQLSGLPHGQSELPASLEVTVRVGQFYLLNADESLPATQSTLSLAETAAFVAKGQKYRRQAERQEFEPREPPPPPPGQRDQVDGIPMMPLQVGGRGNGGGGGVGGRREAPKAQEAKSIRRNRRLGCGFRCGLYPLQSEAASATSMAERLRRHRCSGQQPAEVLDVAIFAAALSSLGFVRTEAPAALPDRQGHGVKLSVKVSTSYEAVLNHDSSLQLERVEERQLNWVHATVLDTDFDDDRLGGGVDTRITVTTAAAVAAGSGLHRSLFKDAATEGFAYIRAAPGGRIRVSERVPPSMRDRIVGIRHRRRAHWFHLADPDPAAAVDAIVAEGDFYPNSAAESDPYIDLSLHFRPDAALSRQAAPLAAQAGRIVQLCDRLRTAIRTAAAEAANQLR